MNINYQNSLLEPHTCNFKSRITTYLIKFLIALPLSIIAGISIAFSQPAPNALPQGGKVAQGSVDISQSGSTLNVKQNTNQNAVVNWKSFNVGINAQVNFAQPSSHAIILNRAGGGSGVSEIYGRLTSNGQVWIYNSAGIWFGPSANVNVGGIMATTANISDKDFAQGNLTGHYQFGPAADGSFVVNEGKIVVSNAGLAALAAPTVVNNGQIEANMGRVVLAGGKTFTVDFNGDQLISFAVGDDKSGKSHVENNGSIIADGGKVRMTAAGAANVLDNTINMKGVVEAKSVGVQNGEIILRGGDVEVSGKLIASGKGKHETGGTVKVLGDFVKLVDNSSIDASGDAGGGEVLIGGNAHGAGSEQNASHAFVSTGTNINADAISNGNGGKVIVWSNDGTAFDGSISVKGGSESGDGGFIETSGKAGLIIGKHTSIDTSAPHGKTGTWLLDPADMSIVDNTDQNNIFPSLSTFIGQDEDFSGSWIGAQTLAHTLNTTDVTVDAVQGAGFDDGNITWVGTAGLTDWTVAHTLTLQAGSAIYINTPIIMSAGLGTKSLVFNSDSFLPFGGITINSSISGGSFNLTMSSQDNININAALNLGNGNLSANTQSGDININAGLNLGSGNLSANAQLGNINIAAGITTTGNVSLQTGDGFAGGAISEIGSGVITANSLTANSSFGISLGNTNHVNSATLSGQGGLYLVNANNLNLNLPFGEFIDSDTITIQNTGNITISSPLHNNINVTASGNITFSGTSGGNFSGTLTLLGTKPGSIFTVNNIDADFSEVTLSVNGTGLNNQLILGASAPTTWNISSNGSGSSIGEFVPFTFSNIQKFKGGSQSDTFNIITPGIVSAIDGGSAGPDSINLNFANIPMTITSTGSAHGMNGGGLGLSFFNIDSFSANPSGANSLFTSVNLANTWTITGPRSGTYETNGMALSFANFNTLTGGSGSDTFLMSGGSVSQINGGSAGPDSLQWVASAGLAVTITSLDAHGMGGVAPGGLGFSNMDKLIGNPNVANTLTGKTNAVGENIFSTWNIMGSRSGTYGANDVAHANNKKLDFENFISLVGVNGAATNTLKGENLASTWNITGLSSGTYTASGHPFLVFNNMGSLVGGSANDTFTIPSGGSVSQVDGGSGTNILTGTNVTNTLNLIRLISSPPPTTAPPPPPKLQPPPTTVPPVIPVTTAHKQNSKFSLQNYYQQLFVSLLTNLYKKPSISQKHVTTHGNVFWNSFISILLRKI